MPYIPQEDRADLDSGQRDDKPLNVGELTYMLYKMCLEYVDDNHVSYKDYAHVMGALECTKMEFYRRILAPYEDIKIRENGDV